MITVNPIYLDYVLTPLIGGADSEEEVRKYSVFNPDSETDVKLLAKTFLLPEFVNHREALQVESKKALAYYLTNDQLDFQSYMDSLLLSIKTPKSPKLFLYQIWQVLFSGEDPEDVLKNKTVTEDYDINAPLKLK